MLDFRIGFTLVPARIFSKVGDLWLVSIARFCKVDWFKSELVIGNVDLRPPALLDFSSKLSRTPVISEDSTVSRIFPTSEGFFIFVDRSDNVEERKCSLDAEGTSKKSGVNWECFNLFIAVDFVWVHIGSPIDVDWNVADDFATTSSCLDTGKTLESIIDTASLRVLTFEITSLFLLYSPLALRQSDIAYSSTFFDELEFSDDNCKRLKMRSFTYKVEVASSGSDTILNFEGTSAFVTLVFLLTFVESSSEIVCETVFSNSFVGGALSFFSSSSSSSKLLRKNAAAILTRSSLAFRMAFSSKSIQYEKSKTAFICCE